MAASRELRKAVRLSLRVRVRTNLMAASRELRKAVRLRVRVRVRARVRVSNLKSNPLP